MPSFVRTNRRLTARVSAACVWLLLLVVMNVHQVQVEAFTFSPSATNANSGTDKKRISLNRAMKKVPANSLLSTTSTTTRSTTQLHLQLPSFLSSIPPKIAKLTATVNVNVDTMGVTAAILLLTSYHVHLYRKEHAGRRTWRSAQADTREAWAQYVRNTQDWTYAIQTLRNAITAQTFLATTVLSLLTVISGRLWDSTTKQATSATAASVTSRNARR